MKKIYLVGKFNPLMQSLSGSLSKFFDVQLCSEHVEFLRGMLEVDEPDLVIVSLADMEPSHVEIFTELKFGYFHIPVICLGTETERALFDRFVNKGQFQGVDSSTDCQELVRMINGRLEARNAAAADGQKPEPSQAPLGAEPLRTFPEPEPPRKEKENRRKRILLVDDNALQLRSLKGSLQNRYDISMAISGAEAIAQIGRKRPDLVFLDYEMPVCDGKRTLEMIRSMEGGEEIPVVFLTGVNDSDNINAVLRLKPAGYLLKPASVEKILDIIHKLIEQ